MLEAARALLQTATREERDLEVEILAPGIDTNPYLTGETSLDWSNPTVAATTAGNLQPASTKALERTGRIGKVGIYDLHTDPAELTPMGRVRIQGQQYQVIEALTYSTHVEAVIELLSTREQVSS